MATERRVEGSGSPSDLAPSQKGRRNIVLNDIADRQPDTFTIRDLFAVLGRYWMLVAAATLAGGVGAYVIGSRVPPVYEAEALLVADAQRAGLTGVRNDSQLQIADTSLIATVVETINSPIIIQSLLATLPSDIRARLEELAVPPNAQRDSGQAIDASKLQDFISDNLTVSNSGRSYVVSAKFRSADQNFSSEIANAVVDAYLKHRLNIKKTSYEGTLRDLSSELSRLEDELRAAEEVAQTKRAQVTLLNSRNEALFGTQLEQSIAESAGLFAQQTTAERRADVIANVYGQLLTEQRNIQARIEAPDVSVQLFSPAVVPNDAASIPTKFLLAPIGVFFGFFASITMAILLFKKL